MRAAALVALMGIMLCGCGAPASESPELVDADGWVRTIAADDPFTDRPALPHCPDWSFGSEDGAFEIRTGGCHYATFSQTAGRDVAAGATLRIRVQHLGLFFEEPAVAHVAVAAQEQLLWERHVPIPSPEDLLLSDVTLDETLIEGEPIYFHLHNHGSNAWRLLGIDVQSSETAE